MWIIIAVRYISLVCINHPNDVSRKDTHIIIQLRCGIHFKQQIHRLQKLYCKCYKQWADIVIVERPSERGKRTEWKTRNQAHLSFHISSFSWQGSKSLKALVWKRNVQCCFFYFCWWINSNQFGAETTILCCFILGDISKHKKAKSAINTLSVSITKIKEEFPILKTTETFAYC